MSIRRDFKHSIPLLATLLMSLTTGCAPFAEEREPRDDLAIRAVGARDCSNCTEVAYSPDGKHIMPMKLGGIIAGASDIEYVKKIEDQGEVTIQIYFKEDSHRKVSDATTRNAGGYIAWVVGGQPIKVARQTSPFSESSNISGLERLDGHMFFEAISKRE